MTVLAYFVFTFVACVLGLGLGLVLHRARTPVAVLSKEDASLEATLESLPLWQAESNRSFGIHIATCALAPLVVAALGWTSRAEVVGSICSGIARVAAQSTLCF